MRPIKLTMKAFGPYREEEIIDFKELGNRNLFLITGPTGAGKTTIFDAISYAIYGEASGSMRPTDSMRSHFSSDDFLTEVSLEFELKGIQYSIHRIPKQMKPRLRGEGTTEQPATATLIIEDGEPRTVITGLSHVKNKVEALLGINAEQFKQIMMIPQGEFQKLLTSSSEDRQKILQQLFDTSLYALIQNSLDDQSKALFNEIRNSKTVRNTQISNIQSQDDAKLEALLAAEDKLVDEIVLLTKLQTKRDEQVMNDVHHEMQENNTLIEKQIEQREKAKEHNDKLALRDGISLKLADKEKESGAVEALKEQMKNAEKALSIIPFEDHFKARTSEWVDKDKALKETSLHLEQAVVKNRQAEAAYAEENLPEKNAMRNGFILEVARLRSYEDKVKNIATIEAAIKTTTLEIQAIEKDIQTCYGVIGASTKRIEELQGLAMKAKDAKIHEGEKRSALSTLEDRGKKLAKLLETLTSLNEQKTLHGEAVVKLEAVLHALSESRSLYAQGNLSLQMNQAAVLAMPLQEGDPCPVCGSTHHEKLAKFTGTALSIEDLSVLEERVKTEEATFFKWSKSSSVLEERVSALNSLVSELLSELASLETLEIEGLTEGETLEVIKHRVGENVQGRKAMAAEIADLQKRSEQHQIFESESLQLKQTLQKAEANRDIAATVHQQTTIRFTEENAALKNIFQEIPEAIRKLSALSAAILEQETLQKRSEDKLQNVKSAYDASQKNFITLTAKQDQQTKDLKDCQMHLEKAREDFERPVLASEFKDQEAYQSAKLSREEMALYQEKIKLHTEALQTLKVQFEQLENQTRDLVFHDLAVFEGVIETMRIKNKALSDQSSLLNHRILNNTSRIKAIEAIGLEIGTQEERYKIIGHLARVAKGNNSKGVTFERFVLATFLEDIIKAANIRLNQMTSGRYKLARTEERERSNAKSGLELEVFDHYTGKSRHVNTLSGGEGFKASLSMALGLADVVQSYAGGVQLDTMFIDEGFGTLDQESLDSAISCLVDLQKTGRLVGIISHVQELKERIDTRLEVHSTAIGSQTQFVIG